MTSKRRLWAIAKVVLLMVSGSALGQEIRYVYDPLGRLIGVVDQDGRTTLYEYDPVGNILAIRRSDITSQVEITFVNPSVGPSGTFVEIFGVGFSDVASENEVSFNGVSALVLEAGETHLTTQVPVGATSGLINLMTPSGSAVSPDVFQVPRISISPTQASVIVEKNRQFTAIVFDSGDQRVVWTVDDVEGGNEFVGTISTSGLYTAPVEVPAPATVRVRGTSIPFGILFAEANVTIVPSMGFVIAGPSDVRVIRTGTGDPGGLPVNTTVAGPSLIRVVRPGIGDSGGFPINTAVAAPSLVSVVRPGTGDTTGLPTNVTVAEPQSVTVVRPGTGDPGGLPPNVTVARPDDVKVKRQ